MVKHRFVNKCKCYDCTILEKLAGHPLMQNIVAAYICVYFINTECTTDLGIKREYFMWRSCLPICDLVSVPKLLDYFSFFNSTLETFTESCQTIRFQSY
jgi:hypothetical protein